MSADAWLWSTTGTFCALQNFAFFILCATGFTSHAFFLQLVIGLMYMAYPQACQHKLTFLLRLRPWCNRLYLKYFLPMYISILAMTVLIDGCFAHIQRYIYRYVCLIYIDSASNKMSGYGNCPGPQQEPSVNVCSLISATTKKWKSTSSRCMLCKPCSVRLSKDCLLTLLA